MINKLINTISRRLRVILYNMKRNIVISKSASIDGDCEIYAGNGMIHLMNAYVRSGARLYVRDGGVIEFGRNVFVNHNCIMYSRQKIEIGNNVQIGPNVVIYDHDHVFTSNEVSKDSFKTSPVIIGDGAWIGANVTILKGAIIGDHCVIAAGSVIRESIPSKSIVYDKRNQIVSPIK